MASSPTEESTSGSSAATSQQSTTTVKNAKELPAQTSDASQSSSESSDKTSEQSQPPRSPLLSSFFPSTREAARKLVEDFQDEDYSIFANHIFSAEDALSFKVFLENGWQSASRMAANLSVSSNATQPVGSPCLNIYDVFLGGSCGNTIWRSSIVIPYLKKRSITYYDPQRPSWTENLIYEEMIAKENSRLFLFVLDPGTINATSFLEIAYLAARKAPKLVVVFLGKREWSDKAHPMDLPDRIRTCNLLEAILTRHSVPMLNSIEVALDFVDEMIIGEKSWSQAMSTPLQRLPFLKVKSRRLLRSSTRSCKGFYSHIRHHMGCYSRRFGLLLFCETMIMLGLLFFVSHSFPVWMLLFPFLALDYLVIIAVIIHYRFKSRQKKKIPSRKIVMPGPPIPRVGPTALSGHGQLTFNDPIKSSAAKSMKSSASVALLLDSLDMVDTEIRRNDHNRANQHQAGYAQKEQTNSKMSLDERLKLNGCITSPVGYDVFLSCSSSSELDWITQKAVPQLHKSNLTYTSALMCDKEMKIPMLHTASHILYYIPSYKTFLSGMIEIAYFIGHSDWQVTVCVPREAECLILLDQDSKSDPETIRAVQRRNECYRMAFCYLKDMAQRRQCRVFAKVEDAIKHIADKSRQDNENKNSGLRLRQIVEKQHLVKEHTRVNLLKHMQGLEDEKKQQTAATS
uniref:Uncharacterized protein n=1 Tax=Ditylenchus dipsaci TaxID=166011 RepID=A0A915EM57_9BILA